MTDYTAEMELFEKDITTEKRESISGLYNIIGCIETMHEYRAQMNDVEFDYIMDRVKKAIDIIERRV